MSYVKPKILNDIALSYVSDSFKSNSYALTNSNIWGHESNYIYVIDYLSTMCYEYSGDDKTNFENALWFQLSMSKLP